MDKLTRALRWNYLLLAAAGVVTVTGIVSVLCCERFEWWLVVVGALNTAAPIINIINIKRIRQGKKPL